MCIGCKVGGSVKCVSVLCSVATPNTLREMVKRVLHPRVAVVHQVSSVVCVRASIMPSLCSIYSYPMLQLPSHLLIVLIRYNISIT